MSPDETPPPEAPAATEAPAQPAAAPEAAAPIAAAAELSPAECGQRLAALFPALFAGMPPKPIKLRIQADLQERAPGQFTRKTLSLFLHRHTTSTAYLKALVASATRFDLDGQPAGEIAAEHREAAVAELERRRAIVEQRRAAEREQQREKFRAQQQAARREQDAEFAARRDRAALLRGYETSTLTRANFCALKQIAEVQLDALLAQARTEREQRPPAAPPHERRPLPPREMHEPRRDHGPRPLQQRRGKPRPNPA